MMKAKTRFAIAAAALCALPALILVVLIATGRPIAAQSSSAVPQPSAAAPSPALDIEGAVHPVLHLTAQDLEGMPAEHVSVSYQTGHGQEQADFTGVQLWTLLERAELIEDPHKRDHLRKTIEITGRDEYAVILAIGELNPNFEGKAVIVAYRRDDQPIPATEGLRLVVPGDKHGGRNVRDVVRIEAK